MAGVISSLVVLLLSYTLAILPLYNAQFCGQTGNFTANSTYGQTRDLILTSLASNVTANGGFFTFTSPASQDSDALYVLGLCRGDLSGEACFNCINAPSQAILRKCTNQKEAVDWADPGRCIVRYSDKSFFGVMDSRPAYFIHNLANITSNVDDFDQVLDSLVDDLRVKAATGSSRLKFATGDAGYGGFDRVYVLLQCTPDLSSSSCSDCLAGAVEDYRSCCKQSRGIAILRPSCLFLYDSFPFYQSVDDGSPPPLAVTSAPPPPPPPVNTPRKQDQRRSKLQTTIIIVAPTSTFIVLVTLSCALFRLCKRKDGRKKLDSGYPYKKVCVRAAAKLLKVSSEEGVHQAGENASETADSLLHDFTTIRAATNEFSDANKLGKGGFGPVYKGLLPDGREIAVKRLASGSEQGDAEFKNEIVLMARLHHRNLVRLIGFCLEGKERLLIYEFLLNSSLDRFIFDPMKRLLLDWDARFKIIVGIARGILYLHEESQLRIIHHDLKAGNVLLDGEMNPKIADFGLARLFAGDRSRGSTRRIVGTYGYIAPEFVNYGRFSMKTDVFSFGVLILEILSGKKNGNSSHSGHVEHLLTNAWKKWREGKALGLIDETMKGGSKSDKMRCIHIGLLCVQEDADKRPTMASVVLMLNSFSTTLPLPSRPPFLMQSFKEPNMSSSDHRPVLNSSVNGVSITEPYPR